jgi:hypothetical protein
MVMVLTPAEKAALAASRAAQKTAKIKADQETLKTADCPDGMIVGLDVMDYSTTVGKWYKENSCLLVSLIQGIETNVEEYNVLVEEFNNLIKGLQQLRSGEWKERTSWTEPKAWFVPEDFLKAEVSWGSISSTMDGMIGTEGYPETYNLVGLNSQDPPASTGKEEYEFGNFWRAKGLSEGGTCSMRECGVTERKYRGYSSQLDTQQKRAAKVAYTKLKKALDKRYEIGEAALELKELKEDLLETINVATGAEIARAGSDASSQLQALSDLLSGDDSSTVDAAARAEANVALRQAIDKPLTVIYPGTYAEKTFSEQCFLLAKIFTLADYKRNVENRANPQTKKLPYYPNEETGNASLMVDGDPYGFINRLTQHPAQSAFFNMKTEEISSLQPTIRLFKIHEEDGEEIQQEFMFDSHASRKDVESLFNNTAKRGFGVGIKDFSFIYDGSTPFAAKKSIKAKLKIFASSFDELLTNRGGSGEPSYTYADLALKTGDIKVPERVAGGSCQSIENIEHNLKKLNYRLKALVGWAVPTGDSSIFTTKSASGKSEIMDAINESYVTLNLTPTTHDFNIDEMGRVNFTIDYLAYIEDFFDQQQFNIFYDEGVAKRELLRKFEYQLLTHPPKGCENTVEYADKFGNWKEKLIAEGTIQRDNNINIQSLMKRLGAFDKEEADPETFGKLYYINLSREEIRGFKTEGPFFESETDLSGKISDTPGATASAAAEQMEAFANQLKDERPKTEVVTQEGIARVSHGWKNRAWTQEELTEKRNELEINITKNSSNFGSVSISYFYVSDLVDVILQGIEQRLVLISDDNLWGETFSKAAGVTGRRTGEQKLRKDDEFGKNYVGWKDIQLSELEKFKQAYKRFRVLLGPLELVKPNKVKKPVGTRFVNLGDIPISTKYFMEWMTDKLIKREQTQYSLNLFLNDFIKDLLRKFLNNDSCFGLNVKQKTILNQAIVTSYKDTEYDEITQWIIDSSAPMSTGTWAGWHLSRAHSQDMELPILNISGPHGRDTTSPIVDGGIKNEINYIVFSAARTQPSETQNGSRSEDEARGIGHYIIGRPRGIVKKISFSKADSQHLQAVRFEQEGYDGLQQLRQVYNVDIDCYANVKAFPGTYIYVDPRGFAPNAAPYGATDEFGRPDATDLTRYGIGGYCMIYRTEHTFAPGVADTKITAAWVAGVDSECGPSVPSSTGDGAMEKKCAT